MMFKKALIAAAMLAAVAGAQAQSANFGVTGTITPAACTITLGAGGIADYGTVTSASVKTTFVASGTHYTMGSRSISYSLSCSAPSAMQLAFADNKQAQLANLGAPTTPNFRYGIGDGAGTTAVGAYQLSLNSTVVDGAVAAGFLSAPTGTTAWTATPVTGVPSRFTVPGYAIGFTKAAADTAPTTLTTVTGALLFDTYMLKSYVDAATSAITMNGSGTITLQYL